MQEQRLDLEASSISARVLDALADLPRTEVAAGEIVFEQGGSPAHLCFLVAGSLEVIKDGRVIDIESRPGSIYGDLSVLLDCPHVTGLRTASDSTVIFIDKPAEFFCTHHSVMLHVCRLLAERLASASRYLVDVRRQFSGESGHLAMLDRMLTILIHRNPNSVKPERTEIRPDH